MFRLFICLLSLIVSTYCFAKPINLYDQPNTTAKMVGTIETDTGIIPIFTQKDGAWMKVGDPRNGNVGWIKSSELSSTPNAGYTITQQIISTGKKPQGYVIQFGSPDTRLTPAESQALYKKIQLQQEAIQKNMQQIMQDMFKNVNQEWGSYPMIMPIVVVPKASTTPASSAPAATPKK